MFAPKILIGLTKYFAHYNGQQPNRALGHQTPDFVHIKPEPIKFTIALCATATAQW
jgi:hypothetical protein